MGLQTRMATVLPPRRPCVCSGKLCRRWKGRVPLLNSDGENVPFVWESPLPAPQRRVSADAGRQLCPSALELAPAHTHLLLPRWRKRSVTVESYGTQTCARAGRPDGSWRRRGWSPVPSARRRSAQDGLWHRTPGALSAEALGLSS